MHIPLLQPLHLHLLIDNNIITVSVSESQALKDLRVKAPEVVKKGANVTLTCDYDLEGVPLYSIRWYRYEVEFYRYLPKESPPTKVFPVKHVEVDVSIPFFFLRFL